MSSSRSRETAPGRPLHVRLWAVIVMLAASAPSWAVAAEKRIALVVGISAYQNAPHLTNPVNDAHAIGDALRRLNFDVQELDDPDFRQLTRGVREFGIQAQDADAAVVYYAGHGVQVDRENYLIPADAKLERERDLLYEAMPLALVLGEVSQARKIGILLLDACRDNPFVERVSRSLVAGRAINAPTGLARVDNVPRNTMVVMATKADQIAEDGGEHSPFAAALLAHLQIPGLELSLFFRSVRDAVLKATDNRQEPYVFSSLGAEPFYFYPRPPNRPPEIGAVQPFEVLDSAGPTPLGLPRPTDPDQDPLTVRITGLPRGGEVRVEGRLATLGEAFSADRFTTATFKPDGHGLGPMGTLDILVEDGRGGSALASLPITVLSSDHPPVVASPRTVRAFPVVLGITPPSDPDGDPLTITVTALPRGQVRSDAAMLRVGDRLRPQDLADLTFVPEPGFAGSAGEFRYRADDGRGGVSEGVVSIDVADAGEAADAVSESGLWENLREHGSLADLDAFLRLFPNSRFGDDVRQRRQQLAAAAPAAPLAVPTSSVSPTPAAAPAAKPAEVAVLQPPRPAAQDVAAAPRTLPVPSVASADSRVFQDCPECSPMVRIPAGAFVMGAGSREPEAAPAHRVTLRAFALGQFPVTVAEWKQCVDDHGCDRMPRMVVAEERTPVHNVSWDDAQQFTTWLARRTGKRYRLPSEAEWEYAARGGTTTRYWWGNQPGVALANCADCGGRQETQGPLPVDAFKPNAFGLYDMLGGVAQWMEDCWVPNYRGAPANGAPREARACLQRVMRGGSFYVGHDDITVTARGYYDSSVRYLANGFRLARDLE